MKSTLEYSNKLQYSPKHERRRLGLRSKNRYRYTDIDKYKELNLKPSMTIPDGTMSIKQIYERHRTHMPLPEVPVYYDEDTGITPAMYNTMDKQDRLELLRQTKLDVQTMQQQALAKQKEQKQREQKEQYEAEIVKKAAEMTAAQTK